MNPLFRPRTIKTILESAPVVIQGAGKLIQMIKEREGTASGPGNVSAAPETTPDPGQPPTLESLQAQITSVKQRLDENSAADVEQIKLIEELARQNEALAESVGHNQRHITTLTIIATLGVVVALLAVLLAVT